MVSQSHSASKNLCHIPTIESLPCGLSLYEGAKIISSIGIVYYTLMWSYSTSHLILRIAWYSYRTSAIGFAVHLYASIFNLTGLLIHTFLLCGLVKVHRRMISSWLRMKVGLALMRIVHVSLLISVLILGIDFPAISHLPLVLIHAFWSVYGALVVYSYYMRTCGLPEAWRDYLRPSYKLSPPPYLPSDPPSIYIISNYDMQVSTS